MEPVWVVVFAAVFFCIGFVVGHLWGFDDGMEYRRGVDDKEVKPLR